MITGVDQWNGFSLAHSYSEVGLFLLDENDLEEADSVCCKIVKMPHNVVLTKFIEVSWDEAYLVIVCADNSIHKYFVKQSGVNDFSLDLVQSIEAPIEMTPHVTTVMPNTQTIVMGVRPDKLFVEKDKQAEQTVIVNVADLTVRPVILHRSLEEERKEPQE